MRRGDCRRRPGCPFLMVFLQRVKAGKRCRIGHLDRRRDGAPAKSRLQSIKAETDPGACDPASAAAGIGRRTGLHQERLVAVQKQRIGRRTITDARIGRGGGQYDRRAVVDGDDHARAAVFDSHAGAVVAAIGGFAARCRGAARIGARSVRHARCEKDDRQQDQVVFQDGSSRFAAGPAKVTNFGRTRSSRTHGSYFPSNRMT